jgi:hypothetical protein
MRRVSMRLLMVLAMFMASAIYADGVVQEPQAKISPPGGIAAPGDEPVVSESAEVRILPPGGAPSDVRVSPPGGRLTIPAREQSLYQSLERWLRTFIRILPPIG